MITRLKGPICIFGAGGFVGINLLKKLLAWRNDVVGVSSNPQKSWRITANKIPIKNIAEADLLNKKEIERLINKHKPQTIFNLAAYGAYSKQKQTDKIYLTNFNSTVNVVEILKKYRFKAYLHAGSQSEYGLNCSGPKEADQLIPNSHYAVSKAAVFHLLQYYGKVERLPVVHLRFYSVYGPWEEPDRLIPTLIKEAIKGRLPSFVDPLISRDFIFINDVVNALITIASNLRQDHFGEAFNICSGKKTTIKDLADIAKKLFKIIKEPIFGKMANRSWDLKEWYGNPEKTKKIFGWQAKISLKEGLSKTYYYEKNNK